MKAFFKFFKKTILPVPNQSYWTTKSGQKILVSNLSDDHLVNIHSLLAKRISFYVVIDKELKNRKLKPRHTIKKQPKDLTQSIDSWHDNTMELLNIYNNPQDLF